MTTNPDITKIATSMVVLSFPSRTTADDIEEALLTSRTLIMRGPIQTVKSGSEVLAVTRLSYKARNASKNHISRSLKSLFDDDIVVHVTSSDVVPADE